MINLLQVKDQIKNIIQKLYHLEIKQLLIKIILLNLLNSYLKLLPVKPVLYIEGVILHKKIQVLKKQVI